ncbi:PepSY domain-containing protein [uncultured Sphingomonas sp.]|uniref:PepSY-associated TM helix domain-containing protein n=1 Tax=uncultured Sphingomonas sp. TaxID=158754 RepID=UPI00261C4CAB|nr:PepSY-associated TM helix domain-containing protein [uncultured Sphingomonas sp.]
MGARSRSTGPFIGAVDWLHRWTGAVIGLLLALLGVSGALLVNAESLFVPAARVVDRTASLSAIAAGVEQHATARPDYIIFASRDFPFHRIAYRDGSGRYLDSAGSIASQWHSQWGRPEIWLFDLHRHLFIGKAGETIVGIAALLGIGFVVTGIFLWWQRRRSFAPRLWPSRISRPAIVRHHRDLGIVIAPLLLLSFVTGTAMALKPVGLMLVSPWSSASEIAAATARPGLQFPDRCEPLDWPGIISAAGRRFPAAEIRLIGFPAEAGDPILVRMRQPDEWLPNGHTFLWFAPCGAQLIAAKDARTFPKGVKILDLAYPLHAAKAGGFIHRLIMTIVGIGLALLGSFSVWSFWIKSPGRVSRRDCRRYTSSGEPGSG